VGATLMRALAAVCALALLLPGCASRGVVGAPVASTATRVMRDAPAPRGVVLGRNERVLVYMPQPGDTWASLAARFLGDAAQAWRIAEANRGDRADRNPELGVPLAVPLAASNPLGIGPEGAQRIAILCWHRIGTTGTKMTITPQRFEAQLDWLVGNGYAVVSLDDVAAFMAGRKELPDKAVALTFDDGYESVWRHAFPALRKRGMPATLFVYTDFVGAGDALSWSQMDEMRRSGLVDIQAHSKSHRNLAERWPGESDTAYRARLDTELAAPRATIERALPGSRVRHFAYPYGDASEAVLEAMQRQGYELGLTVVPTLVPFYAAPLMLGRLMIYGDLELDEFKARVQGRRVNARP
jgi:peptidoglycan/xylan/chitin deacetylase (PgdA/CDA1 family)